VVVQDDRAANVVTLTESYEIDNPFEKDGREWKFYLDAYLVSERAKKPALTERVTPLVRTFPMHVHHEIVAYLPTPWNIEPQVVKISDPAFEYRSDLSYHGGKLHIVYNLRSVADHVPAKRLSEYARQISRVHDDAYFTLTDTEESADSAAAAAAAATASGGSITMSGKPALTGPSLVAILSVFAGLVAGGLAARAVARSRVRMPVAAGDAPVGIDGWLLVPGAMTCLLPPVGGLLLLSLLDQNGSAAAHAALGLLQQQVLASQLALLAVLMVMGALGSWLLCKRIRSYPRMFHAQVVVILGLVALDLLLTWRHGLDRLSRYEQLVAPLFIALTSVATSLYVARSQRVRATFVNDWAPSEQGAGMVPASLAPNA
jgi:Protein of unknown function (DUF2569)